MLRGNKEFLHKLNSSCSILTAVKCKQNELLLFNYEQKKKKNAKSINMFLNANKIKCIKKIYT